ncbi:CACTA en-spm transposon protein [Cucumis melo var. makuwa]|uniref:CACTA en-spm transposon protein n=1 Tax=Cucumis melo var. makuwa TaxID=1194695 RepID=A0A5D3DRN2_CUCMM|nr:CACTA en-spm transposon protein [Cucumis melo var. makuwa]TYK25940.1 CACTA en-spm transposon protein [Cucumis melo var. makuwa]
MRKTFPIHNLKWMDVGREYIEAVKGHLQRFFMLNFNDQGMNRSNHGRTGLLDRSSLTIIAAGQSRFYNYSTSLLGEARPCGVVSRNRCLIRNNQMLKLQFQPTPEGSQPLYGDEICDQVLGRRSSYSKGLGWGPKPKVCKMTSDSSSTTSCSQSTTKREIQIQAKLDQALERIELQDRNF